tara:strand:+ start:40 stop:702 length:663 start_codon:yes stop_codon:yes gene_type:complete
MIINKYKVIFIHIPKNAGTSIETYFDKEPHVKGFQIARKHDNIEIIKNNFPEKYKTYKKFTIIRNPYDRMVSWYFFLKYELSNMWRNYFDLENEDVFGWRFLSFKEFLKNPEKVNLEMIIKMKQLMARAGISKNFIDQQIPYHYNGLTRPQYTWIDETVEIIKFENLNKELSEFFEKEINLPIINKSKHEHFLKYYDKDSLDVVYEKYKKDFKKFNYKRI